MVLMCVLSIELVWVEKYGKMGEKPPFLGISRDGTGTKQSGTGTISVLSTGTGTEFSVPVPNVLFWTSVSILAITWSFRIRIK